ncbi:hypothetical protein LguiB_017473 [Lonicera macranthoides]
MEGETQANKSPVDGKEGADNQFRRETVFGDMIWIKLHGSSWWPAQVVNENNVSKSLKPSNRSMDEVLVRVYGSYDYLFVDPVSCRSEFENRLKETNESCREILEKSLEQDLIRLKPARSKGSRTRPKERIPDAKTPPSKAKNGNLLSEKADSARSRKRRQEGNKPDPSTPKSATTAEGKSQELSTRKVRVMQSLGLIAPPGSPFNS